MANWWRSRSRWVRVVERVVLGAVALVVVLSAAPQLLAFPCRAQIGGTTIYAEQPIPPEMRRVLARADSLTARSRINDPWLQRSIFLTDGGWRWDVLALTSYGAFGLRRPFRDAIVVNTSNIAGDRVENGAPVGGSRTLSGVIAHETSHILVAHHYGEWQALTLPSWKNEGYADFVAQESSLSDAEYAQLRANGARREAMFYYEARRRVAEALRRDRGDLDALFLGS